MEMKERSDISDGYRWRCPDCNKTASIRKGSFFEQSKLTLQKWLLLMHWWARQYPVTDAAVEVEVTEQFKCISGSETFAVIDFVLLIHQLNLEVEE